MLNVQFFSSTYTISSIRAGVNDAKASDLTQQVAHDLTNQWGQTK